MDGDEGNSPDGKTQKTCRERRRKNVRWDPSRRGRQNRQRKKSAVDSDPIGEPQQTGRETFVSEEQNLTETDPVLAHSEENGTVVEISGPDSAISAMNPDNVNQVSETVDGIKTVDEENDKEPSPGETEQVKQRKGRRHHRRGKHPRLQDLPLCGIVFVENRFDARILYVGKRLLFEFQNK